MDNTQIMMDLAKKAKQKVIDQMESLLEYSDNNSNQILKDNIAYFKKAYGFNKEEK
jgi:hypothetical protein